MNKPKLERYPEVTPEKAVSVLLDAADSAKGTWFKSVYLMAVDALRRAPLPDNKALTVEDLREMVGAWVWVIVQYENGKCDGWAFVATPAYIGFLEQIIPIDFCGRKFVAYRRPPWWRLWAMRRWRERESGGN